MASAASGQGQFVTKSDVQGLKGEDLQKFLDQALAEGRGLSPGLVTSLNNRQADYETRDQTVLRHAGMGDGIFSGSLAGAKGAKVPSNYAYFGSTAVTEPDESSRTVNGGWSSTKGSTAHVPIILPKSGFGGQQETAAAAKEQERTPLPPGEGLLAATEAYERAKGFMDQGSSAAGSAPDLSQTGGALMNEIYRAGAQKGDDYVRRFLPYLKAKGDLVAQEIGQIGRDAVAGLSDDVQIPNYTPVFDEQKVADRGGLFNLLRKNIA
jgi:hypothetical protein